MKKQISNHQVAMIAGAMLVFPTIYFMSAAFLNYEMGFSTFWSPIAPIFEKPENKQIGWNINLLFLFGPVLAFVWNFFSIVQIKWADTKDNLQLNFSIRKHWLNISVSIISFMVMASLFAYFIGENCR
jgi:hypothetical protein